MQKHQDFLKILQQDFLKQVWGGGHKLFGDFLKIHPYLGVDASHISSTVYWGREKRCPEHNYTPTELTHSVMMADKQ